MPRKPNYRFERLERERTKAAKKAARAKLKADRAEGVKTDDEAGEGAPEADQPDTAPADE
jgi:hypothetical protein